MEETRKVKTEGAQSPEKVETTVTSAKSAPKWASFLVLALAVGLIGLGVLRDEHRTVLAKAIRICLECVGIG